MQATNTKLAAVELRPGANGGDALAEPHFDPIGEHGETQRVGLQIDWPKAEVGYPVEILVRNRGSVGGLLAKSIIWLGRLGIVRDFRREAWGKQISRKRLRSLGVYRTGGRAIALTSRSGAENAFQLMTPNSRACL